MASNAQVSHAVIRTDVLPEIVHYQNAGVPASTIVAPLYSAPTRSLVYQTLRGTGLLDVTQPGLVDAKSDLAQAVRSQLGYGRQNVDLQTLRWGAVEVDDIQLQEMSAQGVDIDRDWIARHAPQSLTLHAYRLGLLLGTGGTWTGKTGTTLSLSGVDGDVETAFDEATDFFVRKGAYAAAFGGGSLFVYMNHRTHQRLRRQTALSETTFIAGVAGGGSIAVQGHNPLDAVQRYVDAIVRAPVPVVVLVDTQYLVSGTPCIPDGIFFLLARAQGKGSFVSTPVFDYSGIAGLQPGDIEDYAGGTPLGIVREYDIVQGAAGRGWYMESTFGLDLYGVTDAQTENNLGFYIPVSLGS